MYQMAKENPDWYCERLTVDDTDVIPPEMIEAERQAGMSEAMIQQEFYCSFDIPVEGAYYADQINAAYASKRIGKVPIDPILPVYTFWDLGIGDSTAIWFAQSIGQEIRLIHAYENSNEGMAHYINYLREFAKQHNIRYGGHYAPHDIEVRELMSGKSSKVTAREMGINFHTVKRHAIMDGIEAVRRLFPRFFIDDTACEQGLAALSSYAKKFDDKNMVWTDKPNHDWSSHYADGVRCLAMAWNDKFGGNVKRFDRPHIASSDFDVF